MTKSKLFIRKVAEVGLFSFLLLLGSLAYGDGPQELAPGEGLVILNVENMT